MQIEVAQNTEEATEKIHPFPVDAIVIDTYFQEKEIQKITKS